MSVCNADPWQVKNNSTEKQNIESSDESFEDNFTPQDKAETQLKTSNNNNQEAEEGDAVRPHEPLPDSANYLQLLERKLAKVQKGAKLLDSLQEKRQDCMRTLLSSNGVPTSTLDQLIELDTPIESGRLQRHLLPIQAVTIGETVRIVEHDALEAQIEEAQQELEEETN